MPVSPRSTFRSSNEQDYSLVDPVETYDLNSLLILDLRIQLCILRKSVGVVMSVLSSFEGLPSRGQMLTDPNEIRALCTVL